MPNKCCVFGCNYHLGHHFPSDKKLTAQWIQAIKREKGFSPSNNNIVCRRHFREEDYLDGPTSFGKN